MEIRAKCKCDYDSVKALARLAMFRKADPKKRLKFYTIIYAILFVVIILEIIAFDVADTILFVLLGVEITVLLFLWFGYFIVPKMRFKSMAKMKNTENQYIFCDNVLKVFTKSQDYNGEAEIEYSFFVRVYETTKYLFIFQTCNQVLVVDKSTIEEGTAEDIRNKLSSYVKDKYIICKY